MIGTRGSTQFFFVIAKHLRIVLKKESSWIRFRKGKLYIIAHFVHNPKDKV
jgi:hypothetical protein